MRITERRLRQVIRQIIKESMHGVTVTKKTGNPSDRSSADHTLFPNYKDVINMYVRKKCADGKKCTYEDFLLDQGINLDRGDYIDPDDLKDIKDAFESALREYKSVKLDIHPGHGDTIPNTQAIYNRYRDYIISGGKMRAEEWAEKNISLNSYDSHVRRKILNQLKSLDLDT